MKNTENKKKIESFYVVLLNDCRTNELKFRTKDYITTSCTGVLSFNFQPKLIAERKIVHSPKICRERTQLVLNKFTPSAAIFIYF